MVYGAAFRRTQPGPDHFEAYEVDRYFHQRWHEVTVSTVMKRAQFFFKQVVKDSVWPSLLGNYIKVNTWMI